MTARARERARFPAAFAAVLVGAGVLRAWTLSAALPYTSYVDEGHVLHPAARMIARGTWDPGKYQYPSLPIEVIAAVTRVLGGAHVVRDAKVADRSPYYDLVAPASMITLGRIIVLLAALATVALVMLVAYELRGRRAALVAGVFAAVLPAFVTRSSIVIVDTFGACFAALSVYCATRVRADRRAPRHVMAWVIASGAAAGLAFTSKYTAGTCVLVVLLVVAARRELDVRRRVQLVAAAAAAAVVFAVVSMPALLLREGRVRADVRTVSKNYQTYTTGGSYLRGFVTTREAGALLTLAAVAGLVVLARTVQWRGFVVGVAAFAVALYSTVGGLHFQPFRNMLPVLPVVCAAAGVGVVAACNWIAGRAHFENWVRATAVTVVTVAIATTMVVWGDRPYVDASSGLVDSRVAARRWLDAHVRHGDGVLVAQELAFLPSEMERVHARVASAPSVDLPRALAAGRYRYEVVATLAGRPRPHPPFGFRVVARFGHTPTTAAPQLWRTNDQLVEIYATG